MIVYTFLSVTVATHQKQEETGAKKENTRATQLMIVVTIGQTALKTDCRLGWRHGACTTDEGSCRLVGSEPAGHLLAVELEGASAWSFLGPEGASNLPQVLMVEASQGSL